jgi:hypothetical protein
MSLQVTKLASLSRKLTKFQNGVSLARQLGTAAAQPNRNPKIEYTQVNLISKIGFYHLGYFIKKEFLYFVT